MNPVSLSILSSRPRPRIVWGRRNLLVAAGALLWGLSGCTLPDDGEPDEQVDAGNPPVVSGGRQVRTTFRIRVNDFSDYPGAFLLLDEAPNAGGLFEGTLTLASPDRTTSVAVAALLDGAGELTVAAGAAAGIVWDELRIDLREADSDGVYESGSGHIEGRHTSYGSEDPFAHDFEAAPDAFRAVAKARPDGDLGADLLPWQPLVIELGQPVSIDQITSYALLADGKPIAGETRLLEADPYYYTAVHFVPEAFYPPGAELTLVTTDMKNLVGTAVASDPTPLRVLSDPGPANDNLGFEQGFAGWSAVGNVTTEASYGDVVPGEGAAMAVIQSVGLVDYESYEGRLIGYLDVPADASELELSLEVVTGDQLPAEVTVRLYRDDAFSEIDAFDIYEFGHETETLAPCDCADVFLTRRTGSFRRQVSLAPFRGERVFLELRVDGHQRQPSLPPQQATARGVLPIPPPPPPVLAALIIDDIQIR